MSYNPSHNIPSCGRSLQHPIIFGDLDYTAEQINELLSLIPFKADRAEVPEMKKLSDVNYLGHVADATLLPEQEQPSWALVGNIEAARPYFFYVEDFVPKGYQPGWNDLSQDLGTYNLTALNDVYHTKLLYRFGSYEQIDGADVTEQDVQEIICIINAVQNNKTVSFFYEPDAVTFNYFGTLDCYYNSSKTEFGCYLPTSDGYVIARCNISKPDKWALVLSSCDNEVPNSKNYNSLKGRPSINGVTLSGNHKPAELDLPTLTEFKTLKKDVTEVSSDAQQKVEYAVETSDEARSISVSAESKSDTAVATSNEAKRISEIARNAVATLEGLANATTAAEALAGQIVQIEENKQNIASNKADADSKLSELGSELNMLGSGVEIANEMAGSALDSMLSDVELKMNNYYNGYGMNIGDSYNKNMTYRQGTACTKIEVSEGEAYRYNGKGTEYVTSYIITDSSGVITRKSTNNFERITEELRVQANEKYLYVSFNTYDASIDYLKKKVNVNFLSNEVAALNYTTGVLDNAVNPKVELKTNAYYKGYGYNVGDLLTEQLMETTGTACAKISVSEGEHYIHSGSGSDYVRKYIITDSLGTITRISTSTTEGKEDIVIASGEVYLYANFNKYNAEKDSLRAIGGINKELSLETESINKKIEGLVSAVYPKLPLVVDRYYKRVGYNVGDEYTGSAVYAEGFACVKVEVSEGDKYMYYGGGSTDYVSRYIITDSSGIITRISTTKGRGTEEIVIKSNESVMYVTFNGYNADTDYIQEFKQGVSLSGGKPLSGKNIVCFGDSITEFSNEGKRVTDYLSELSGANVTNVAIGGTRLAQRTDNIPSEPNNEFTAYAALDLTSLISSVVSGDFSKVEYAANWLKDNVGDNNTAIIERLKAVNWNSIDAVTILIGTNDYAGGTQLGNSESADVRSICGAIQNICNGLLTKYPHLTIYFFTPVPRWMASSIADRTDENWAGNKANSNGKTLVDYVDAIYNQCRLVGVPVCDTYRTIGWTKYNLGNYLQANGADGVHPYLGFESIAKRMIGFIQSNNVL